MQRSQLTLGLAGHFLRLAHHILDDSGHFADLEAGQETVTVESCQDPAEVGKAAEDLKTTAG